jgi:hypothetical protein
MLPDGTVLDQNNPSVSIIKVENDVPGGQSEAASTFSRDPMLPAQRIDGSDPDSKLYHEQAGASRHSAPFLPWDVLESIEEHPESTVNTPRSNLYATSLPKNHEEGHPNIFIRYNAAIARSISSTDSSFRRFAMSGRHESSITGPASESPSNAIDTPMKENWSLYRDDIHNLIQRISESTMSSSSRDDSR